MDVTHKRADERFVGRRRRLPAREPRDDRKRRDEAARYAFHVSLHSAELACVEEPRHLPVHLQGSAGSGSVDERVSVNCAVAKDFGLFEAGQTPDYGELGCMPHACLEADQAKERSVPFLLSELHDCIRLRSRAGVGKSLRPQGPETKGIFSPGGHHLDRQACLEIAFLFERMKGQRIGAPDPLEKTGILPLIERHIEYTGSPRAEWVLDNWAKMLPRFVKVFPHEYKRVLGVPRTSKFETVPAVRVPDGKAWQPVERR